MADDTTGSRIEEAIALMMDFAQRTGLSSERPQQRYLWTDAFAVCNLLGLGRVTEDTRYTELALRLVDQVHHSLGRHRGHAPRSGWLSGLSEAEGEAHPTRGGLRIGKALPERGPDEPFDERLEWDRDGQYFHYLTKWMHALDQVTRATGQPRFNLWARELAETAYRAFTYPAPDGDRPRRMVWKMSVDLSRALVPAMGQHDPLDGYVTYIQLRATASRLKEPVGGPLLDEETGQFAAMIEDRQWATADPLGLGGLLSDALRVDQLMRQGAAVDRRLREDLLTAALAGLQHYVGSGELHMPGEYRLAFRELGLAIGLHAVRLMGQAAERGSAVRARLQALMQYTALGDEIGAFWRDAQHRHTESWSEHRDINEVMLATSLASDGLLVLSPPGGGAL
jgi:hypothetical protein